MGPVEAGYRDKAERLIDDAIDGGLATPGERTHKRRCVAITEEFLSHRIAEDEDEPPCGATGPTPLDDIRRERVDQLVNRGRGTWSDVVAPTLERVASAGDAAVEEPFAPPLLSWLLSHNDGRLPLTATGNLGRALVREAVDAFPWLYSHLDLFGPPHT